jgi:hypothetical protein
MFHNLYIILYIFIYIIYIYHIYHISIIICYPINHTTPAHPGVRTIRAPSAQDRSTARHLRPDRCLRHAGGHGTDYDLLGRPAESSLRDGAFEKGKIKKKKSGKIHGKSLVKWSYSGALELGIWNWMDLNRFFFRIWWGFHGKMWWFSWDLMRIKPVDRDSWWLMGYDFGELGVRWFNTASFRGAVLIVRFKAWHMENSGYVYYIYMFDTWWLMFLSYMIHWGSNLPCGDVMGQHCKQRWDVVSRWSDQLNIDFQWLTAVKPSWPAVHQS